MRAPSFQPMVVPRRCDCGERTAAACDGRCLSLADTWADLGVPRDVPRERKRIVP